MKNFFKELLDMKSKEVENVTPPKDTEMEVQTKTSLADRYNNWWERENAKAFFMGNGDMSRKRNLTVRIQRFVYRLYAQRFMD